MDTYGIPKKALILNARPEHDDWLTEVFGTKAQSPEKGQRRLNHAHIDAMPQAKKMLCHLRDQFVSPQQEHIKAIKADVARLEGLKARDASLADSYQRTIDRLTAYAATVETYLHDFEDRLQYMVGLELHIRHTPYNAEQITRPEPIVHSKEAFLEQATDLAKKTAQDREVYYLFYMQQQTQRLHQRLRADADHELAPYIEKIQTQIEANNDILKVNLELNGVLESPLSCVKAISLDKERAKLNKWGGFYSKGHRDLTELAAQENAACLTNSFLGTATGKRLQNLQRDQDYTVFTQARQLIESVAWDIIAPAMVAANPSQYNKAYQRTLQQVSRAAPDAWANQRIPWDEFKADVMKHQIERLAHTITRELSRRTSVPIASISAAVDTKKRAAGGNLKQFTDGIIAYAETKGNEEIASQLLTTDRSFKPAILKAIQAVELQQLRFDAAQDLLISTSRVEFDEDDLQQQRFAAVRGHGEGEGMETHEVEALIADLADAAPTENPYEKTYQLIQLAMDWEQKLQETDTSLVSRNNQKREFLSKLVQDISSMMTEEVCRPKMDVNKPDHALLMINSVLQDYLRTPKKQNLFKNFSLQPGRHKRTTATDVLKQLRTISEQNHQDKTALLETMKTYLEGQQRSVYQYDMKNWVRKIFNRPAKLHDSLTQSIGIIEDLLAVNPRTQQLDAAMIPHSLSTQHTLPAEMRTGHDVEAVTPTDKATSLITS